MGDEFAQRAEWSHEASLDWHLLAQYEHRGVDTLVTRINALYRSEPALHRDDLGDLGFSWIDGGDRTNSVASIERHDGSGDHLVCVLNATPEPRHDYLVGMPTAGRCGDFYATEFGGSGHVVRDVVETEAVGWHGRHDRAALVLPPLGFVVYGRR